MPRYRRSSPSLEATPKMIRSEPPTGVGPDVGVEVVTGVTAGMESPCAGVGVEAGVGVATCSAGPAAVSPLQTLSRACRPVKLWTFQAAVEMWNPSLWGGLVSRPWLGIS